MSPLQREIRRRPADVELKLGPARLYLDDIRDIYDLLKSFAEKLATKNPDALPPDVSLTAGEATAASIDDLKDATSKELRDIHMSLFSRETRVWISLSPISSRASVNADDTEGRALVEDIAYFINKRRSSATAGLFAHPFLYFCSLMLSGAIATLSWQVPLARESGPVARVAVYVALGLALGAIWECIAAYRYGAIRVISQWRSESRGISSETRRAIYIAVASAVVGGIATAVITALVGDKPS
ncbi:hypothetical protein [Micromonospora ureilytica]|uniref:hypothetical protein n=1 Tax=Micromonospora ureilytica TaxID=709868 RepID=UPI00403A3040